MIPPSSDISETVSWPLTGFSVGKDFEWTRPKLGEDRTEVFVDRATHEFGIIYYDCQSVAAVERFLDTDEPVYFEAKTARAACKRDNCSKVTVLFQHLQLDLQFDSSDHAHGFVTVLEGLAAATQNKSFRSHTVIAKGFSHLNFDMANRKYTECVTQPWIMAPAVSSHWSKIRDSGEWSDFTIFASGTPFPVHRVKLCEESLYFRVACTGGFVEAEKRTIELPEPEHIISAMLDEVYETYNSTAGSLFTGFVLRSELEKERALNDLLDLFVASDKYNLERIKIKVAQAIVDRLSFVRDSLTIVDTATCIFDDQFPQVDRGLRKAIITQIQQRLPAIMNNGAAWQAYSENNKVLKAFHARVACLDAPLQPEPAPALLSPPVTPTGGKRKRSP